MSLGKQEIEQRIKLIENDMQEIKSKMDVLGNQYQQLTGHYNCMHWALTQLENKDNGGEKELDCGGNQETGCAEEGIGSEEGRENS